MNAVTQHFVFDYQPSAQPTLQAACPHLPGNTTADKDIEISPTRGMVWQDWRLLADQKEKLLLWQTQTILSNIPRK